MTTTDATKTGFFEESPGVLSMARLIEFMTFLLILVVVGVVCWMAVRSPTHTFPDIPGGISSLLGAMFVASVAGKVTQAVFGEKTATVTTTPSS